MSRRKDKGGACPSVDQYRLCNVDATLDEECMQKTPLRFVGQSTLRWGGPGGRELHFNATDLSGAQVVPLNSTWRKNPIPRNDPCEPNRLQQPLCLCASLCACLSLCASLCLCVFVCCRLALPAKPYGCVYN